MIDVRPIDIEGYQAIAISISLPKTTLLMVTTEIGFIMCGALDIGLLNEKLRDRGIIAGRAVGVRTIDQLMEAPLESVTHAAESLGIKAGMSGREAVLKMF